MHDDDFPELQQLMAMQKSRHRKVIAGLIVGGLLAVAAGLTIFAFADPQKGPSSGGGPVGIVLIGVGAVLVVRGLVSAFTDIDLRATGELDPLTGDDDEPRVFAKRDGGEPGE